MEGQPGALRALARLVLPYVLVILGALLVYRVAFVLTYVRPEARGDLGAILLYGMRLDLALVGAWLALHVFLSLVRTRITLRGTCVSCLLLTGLCLTFAVMNFVFYGARDDPMGRLFVANLTSPKQLFGELAAFTRAHPGLMGLGVVLLVGYVIVGVRLIRRQPKVTWRLVKPLRRVAYAVLLIALLLVPVFQPIEIVEGDVEIGGWTIDLASARHFQRFDDHAVNQTIPNPLHEILFSRLPQAFSSVPPPRLAPEEACAVLRESLSGDEIDPSYPLLRRVSGASDLGLEHVVIVQVEGLSGSIVEKQAEGRPVMPFLAGLAGRSLYFPNTIQTYPTTYGGLHGTTASLPRTTSCVTLGRFTYEEAQGYFGSLPRILDRPGACQFFHGARTCADDMRAYMGNQGFVTADHHALRRTLAGTRAAEQIEGEIGIWDLPCLEEAARQVLEAEEPTVVHVMTATSHSPWTLPDGYPVHFDDRVLCCFRYVDDAIRALFERLAERPEVLDRTLVIVTADHVSFGYGTNRLDWARIPLIFHNPGFASAGLARRDARWATLPDVVPTVLALLGGMYDYAGLGRNLLADELPFGVVFSNEEEACYLEGDRLLCWNFARDAATIHQAGADGWGGADCRAEDPPRAAALERTFFGLYEATRAAVSERRIYPR